MQRIPEFVANHPLLFVALAATIAMIVFFEVQRMRRAATELSPAGATRLSNSEDAVFIDTRSQRDFEQGHIPHARPVPSSEIDNQIKQLEKLRERPVVLYDEGGMDAQRVARKLAEQGFNRLYAIEGGMPAWRKAELPVQQGSGSGKGQQGASKKNKKKSRKGESSE